MNQAFQPLRAAAADLIKSRHRARAHELAAAVMGASGKIYAAVNLDCFSRSSSTCAESGAIAAALSAGEAAITAILTVRYNADHGAEPSLVSPCGRCRELIADYGKDAIVFVPDHHGGHTAETIGALLPNRYAKQGKNSI